MILTIAERVKIIAKRQGITLTELAAALGCSKQTLHNRLNKKSFSRQELDKIAAALNCTYEDYFILNDTHERI